MQLYRRSRLRTLVNYYAARVCTALLKARAALARASGAMICRTVGGCLLFLLVKSMTALSRYNRPPSHHPWLQFLGVVLQQHPRLVATKSEHDMHSLRLLCEASVSNATADRRGYARMGDAGGQNARQGCDAVASGESVFRG